MIKNLPAMPETWVQSLGWKDTWKRAWQPTPVFLPGESHGQRSLAGCSPWCQKKSDMTEWLGTQHTDINFWSHECRHTECHHSSEFQIRQTQERLVRIYAPHWLTGQWQNEISKLFMDGIGRFLDLVSDISRNRA